MSLYDHCGIVVKSFWVCEGRFSKNIHFPMRFNNLIRHRRSFGVVLMSLWAYEGDFGSISVRLRGHFGVNLAYECDFGGTWSTFCAYDGDFASALEPLWN